MSRGAGKEGCREKQTEHSKRTTHSANIGMIAAGNFIYQSLLVDLRPEQTARKVVVVARNSLYKPVYALQYSPTCSNFMLVVENELDNRQIKIKN